MNEPERNTKGVENIMERVNSYVDGVRVLMLAYRNKDGGKNTRPDRFSVKRVSKNATEFADNLQSLIDLKNKSDKPLRIYSSLNPRNIEKAIREFKRRQLEADYYDVDSKHKFYLDIKNQWFSSLMKPQSKDGSLFLFDIDSQVEYSQFQTEWNERMLDNGGVILDRFPTKNGWHVITEPFNPDLMSGHEIKKDGLLLLDW